MTTTARKGLSTRPVSDADLADRMNRELIPYMRQITKGTAITGSVSGSTSAVVKQILTVLAAAGILTDSTVP